MALWDPLNVLVPQDEQNRIAPSKDSSLSADQKAAILHPAHFNVDSTIESASRIISLDRELRVGNQLGKIEPPEFPVDRPWLPQQALKILNKLTKEPIAEKELIRLMDLVADRAIDHFQLKEGGFVALTFLGRIVEVSDTRIGLLREIQGHKFTEEIFVWRVGFRSFSGRL